MEKVVKSPWFVFGMILACILGYAGILLWNIWPIDSKTLGQAGVFGDSFGALTSLFSALAFGGLIITIWQQQEELELTRSEMKDQHFQNILFKMLEIYNTIVNDIDFRSNGVQTATGRDCFLILFKQRLKKVYDEEKKNFPERKEEDLIRISYKRFWDSNQGDLGHYFRYVYNIFNFIDKSKIKEKTTYTRIARAQLSDYELLILFYNCLYVHGEKFKPLVEKYALFDNLPQDLLLKPSHTKMYEISAFGA